MSRDLESEFGDITNKYKLTYEYLKRDEMETSVHLVTESNRPCVLISRKYSSSDGGFQWEIHDMITNRKSPIYTDLEAAKSFLSNMLVRLRFNRLLGAQATPDAWHALSRLSDMVERLAVAQRY